MMSHCTFPDELLEVFTQAARDKIEEAKEILRRTYADVISGSISIKTFNLITQPEQPRIYQQFVELYSTLHPGASGEHIATILEIRRQELGAFRDHVELNKTLCRLCEMDELGKAKASYQDV